MSETGFSAPFSLTLKETTLSEPGVQYSLNKNSAECYVAPALCLHIRNSMKASV